MKYFWIILLIFKIAIAEDVKNIVEFMSFGCSHCYQAEPTIRNIVSTSNIKYIPVIIAQSPNEEAISTIYTAAMLSGVGWQFRQNYFDSVFIEGYPAYSPLTVSHVLSKLGVDANSILELAKSTKVQEKIKLDKELISKYKVNSTPTFIINGTVVLEGDTALNNLLIH